MTNIAMFFGCIKMILLKKLINYWKARKNLKLKIQLTNLRIFMTL